MNNVRKKIYVSIATVAVISSAFTAGIMAQTTLEKIQAFKDNGVSFKVSGKSWTALDSKGKKLSPIRYNDTLYVPVAAIAKATGFTYKYDNKKQLVELAAPSVGGNPSTSVTPTASPKATPTPVEYANPSKLTLDMFTENFNKAKESDVPVITRSEFTLGNYPKATAKIFDYKYISLDSKSWFNSTAFTDPETAELVQVNSSIQGPNGKGIMRSLLSGMLGGPGNAEDFIQKSSFFTELNRVDVATPKNFTYKNYMIQHYRLSGDSIDGLYIYTIARGQN